MPFEKVNRYTGEVTPITDEEYQQAQQQARYAREGFMPNLKKAFESRANQIKTLGNPTTPPPEVSPNFAGNLGQLLGSIGADVPAIAAASTTGAGAAPLLLAYGTATSPAPTGAEKLMSGLLMGLPAAAPKIAGRLKSGISEFSEPMSAAERPTPSSGAAQGEAPPSGAAQTQTPRPQNTLKQMIDDLQRPGKIEKEIEEIKPIKEAEKLKSESLGEDFTGNIDSLIEKKNQLVEQKANNLENKLQLGDMEGARGDL